MFKKLVIVGVGMIGGSVGSACRQRNLAEQIVGVGRNHDSLDVAVNLGIIDRASTDLIDSVNNADFVVICSPVDLIAQQVIDVIGNCSAIVTDTGSTKNLIVQMIDTLAGDQTDSRDQFVGSHPIAGSEKSGPENSNPDLFQKKRAIITPTRFSNSSSVKTVTDFWQALGASTIELDAVEHDRAMASISHLPHVLASVLAGSTPPEHLKIAGSGFDSSTRVADGPASIWHPILTHNKNEILKSLDRFEQSLAQLRKAIHEDNDHEMIRILKLGKKNREALGN